MNGLAKSITEQRANLTILRRIATGDQTTVQDCLDHYGNLLWYLAEKFFGTSEEKEDAVQEISIAIWQNAGRFNPEKGVAAFKKCGKLLRKRLIRNLLLPEKSRNWIVVIPFPIKKCALAGFNKSERGAVVTR